MKQITLSLVALLATNILYAQSNTTQGVEYSANVALTSNYVWRGMSQSSNQAAIQGGFDASYQGFYVGTWLSSVDFNTEVDNSLEYDVYAGYAGEAYGIGYDVGYLLISYPGELSTNKVQEAYLGLNKSFGNYGIYGTYSFGLEDAPDDYIVGATANLSMGFEADVHYGEYDTMGKRYGASLSKTLDKFTLSVSYYNFEADSGESANEDGFIATLSTSF